MRTVVGALALGTVIALAGCGGGQPIPTLPPTPSSTPIFASDEEALAAAEDAYRAYLEMSNLIANQGGVDPERIAPFVTGEYLGTEIQSYSPLSSKGLRTEGHSVMVHDTLQQASELAGIANLTLYVCLSVEGVHVLDAQGEDVTPKDRPSVIPLEVEFEGPGPNSLQVARSDQWSGQSFC